MDYTNTITNGGRELADRIARYVGWTTETERICSLLARHARTYDRIQEAWCNDEMTDRRRAAVERKEAQLEKRITGLAWDLPHWEDLDGERGPWKVRFKGDPRGATVLLLGPSGREISCHVKGR